MINKKIIHSVFENMVVQKPNNIAIETEGTKISYSKLNSQSNQIAHLLKNIEIDKGDVVAVFFNQVLVQILSLIGIFKKGAIYLPLDKKYKQNHWGELFTNIKPKALLVSQEYFEIVKEYNALYGYSIPKIIVVTLGPKMELQFSIHIYSDGDYMKNECSITEENANLELPLEGDDSNHIFFTSGSTGKPKAVLGNHKSLSHFVHWETKELKVTENDKIGQLTSLSFDASLRDIFLPLMNGASICIPTGKIKEDVNQLSDWLKKEKITILHTVPTMLRLLLNADDNGANFSELRYLLLAGEKLYNRDIISWREKYNENTCIINLYGATESTLVKSFHRVESHLEGKQSDSISVGKPISNTVLIILNSENKLCNVNEKGSIYIKTPFLSSGYYKDETLTKEKFVQNPLSSEKDIIYKTGDYGKYDTLRNITVLGREDGVVKINGIRCDINSIESTVLELDKVKMVKCLVKENEDGNKSIIGFYTSKTPLTDTINNHCFKYLPHYEVPSLMIHLGFFPTNANGKVDTIYLNKKAKEVAEESQQYDYPTNEIEKKLLDVWREVLKINQIGIQNNFLSFGGNSIKQVLLKSKIRTEFSVNLTIEDLFTHPTIRTQALLISSLITSQSVSEYDRVTKVIENENGYVVSNEQLRIWITSQSKAESIAHNMSYTYDIYGDFDVVLFKKAIAVVIDRYEILRTWFSINDQGNVVQKVSDEIQVENMFTHLTLDENSNEEQIKKYIREFTDYVFNLEKAPLFRFQLIQLENQKFVLSTLMHHIIGDYTSDQIIIGEILKLYNTNSPLVLKELDIQYKDYASWITKRLTNNEFVSEKKFWLDHLDGTFKQEKWYMPVATTDYKGEYFIKKLPETLTKQIKNYCLEYNQNLMSVFASALGVLIHKISGQRETIIGLPINLRNHPDLLNQVGLYLNVLPLKIKIDPQNSVRTVLNKTSKDQIKMMDNSFYPFDNIIEDFEQKNNFNISDRIDLYMNFINHNDSSDDSLGDLTIIPRGREMKMSKFPICFYVNNRGPELSVRIEYQTCIFDQKEISKLGERFIMCLEKTIKNPDTSVQEISLVETTSIPTFSLG